eukprot:527116-Alexandrium_andersonii.AAC.1
MRRRSGRSSSANARSVGVPAAAQGRRGGPEAPAPNGKFGGGARGCLRPRARQGRSNSRDRPRRQARAPVLRRPPPVREAPAWARE